MKSAWLRQICGLLAICLLAGWVAEDRLPGKLRKGFEALDVFNYFEAKKIFEDRLAKNTLGASYGLSILYGRSDNPFTNLDSAYKYIYLADSLWPLSDFGERLDYIEVNIDSAAIVRQIRLVDSLTYDLVFEASNIDQWNEFISRHKTPDILELAISERNALAYRRAELTKTSAAYEEFFKSYPEADQVTEAKARYEKALYDEITAGDRVRDFQDYLEAYPQGPYAERAEDAIFAKFTNADTPEVYLVFIDQHQNNRNVPKAWRRIYAKEIGDESPRAIAAFSLKYPNYPFIAELQKNFELATTRYYPVKKDGLWGYIDESGDLKIEPEYDWNEPFREGLAIVAKDDKVGFIEKSGNLITDLEFDDAFSFRNGYAVVETEGRQGLVDRAGISVIAPNYDECGEMSEGLAYLSNDGLFGYVDGAGRFVVDFVYDDATDFSAGMAVVDSGGKKGFINQSGALVIPCGFDWAEPFKGDFPTRTRKGSKFGLVSRDGTLIADSTYDQIGEVSDGFYLAANGENYGFINAMGDTVVPFSYSFSQAALLESKFIDGYAKVFQKGNTGLKVGIIDTLGKKVMPAIFDGIGAFGGSLIAVSKKGAWGYSDNALNLAIPYLYDEAFTFRDSIAKVSKKGRYGLIDQTGAIVLDLNYTHLVLLDSLVLVSDTAFGIISLRKTEIVPLVYEKAEVVDDFVVKFTDRDGAMSYFDYRRQRFIWREAE